MMCDGSILVEVLGMFCRDSAILLGLVGSVDRVGSRGDGTKKNDERVGPESREGGGSSRVSSASMQD